MKVAIIGCGLIGEKRAKALGNNELIITSDINLERAKHVGNVINQKTLITNNWKEAAGHPEVDLVIISTSNNYLTPIALFAIENNKHVLIEKPGARSSNEIHSLFTKSKETKKKIKVGFNLRYHPSMIKIKEIIDSGSIGELMFIRGRYGHGGRIVYEKEWRADESISGGGELIDQGVHLIDLSRYILGDFKYVDGFTQTYFWNMKVDDNGFISLRTENNKAAWLQVSCTEWKNLFSLEIYGKYGKLQVDGLGGSYGIERLSYYKMKHEMGPPDTTIWEYPGEDKSWKLEFDNFIDAIENDKPLNGNIDDAYQALVIVDKIYKRIK